MMMVIICSLQRTPPRYLRSIFVPPSSQCYPTVTYFSAGSPISEARVALCSFQVLPLANALFFIVSPCFSLQCIILAVTTLEGIYDACQRVVGSIKVQLHEPTVPTLLLAKSLLHTPDFGREAAVRDELTNLLTYLIMPHGCTCTPFFTS